MINIVSVFGYFITCEVVVSKGFIPKFMQDAKQFKIIGISILIILTSALVGWAVHLMAPLLVMSTIYTSAVISHKYIRAFETMEKGKRI